MRPAKSSALEAQKALLRERFGDGGWESRRILEELDRVDELYFDRVSQIVMDRWSRGRVALVGDAAFCISLLGGQGSALAMTSAYALAGELAESAGRYEAAFCNYEELLRPYIAAKQTSAERFAGFFAPKNAIRPPPAQICNKNVPFSGFGEGYAIGKDIVDRLQLPDYRFAK